MNISKEDKACVIGVVFGCVLTLGIQNAFYEDDLEKGREETLSGKVIYVLDKMEEDKPKFNCKTKEEFNKDIEFLLKSGMVKKKEGSPL